MAKMNKKMIYLCSAAVGTVYMAGYMVTMPSDTPAFQDQTSFQKTKQVAFNGHQSVNRQKEQTVSSKIQSKIYKDGTYYGKGTNRIGSVQVAVTIKNDAITNVEITNCDTHYSQSNIDGLPHQVIVRQSPNVDVVSGATRSTEDFQTAVEEAIQQAKL